MILDKIVEDKKIRLVEHKARISFEKMRELAEKADYKNHGFYEALAKPGISIIGEYKQASPSLGAIESKVPLSKRIEDYNSAVDAISCLTEEDHFSGNVEIFKEMRAGTALPMIRKDFMIDEYQFFEARAIGADAVLLIVAILDDAQLKAFYDLSRELGLDVLVETHDEWEIERALKIDPRIVGVNNRNLKTFEISLDNTKKLRGYVPEDKVFVAESGIMADADVKFLLDCKVDAFLIGRALMESDNPAETAKNWKNL